MDRGDGYATVDDFIAAARRMKAIHGDIRDIFVSTEDASVIAELERDYSNEFRFLYTTDHKRHDPAKEEQSIRKNLINGEGINSGMSESSIAYRNLFLAADCDFFIGTFSSNWSRLVFELMVANRGYVPVHESLDEPWFA